MRQFLIEKKDPQHNQLWEWEETQETVEALKKLHESMQKVNDQRAS